jgi:hypothetical protein
MFVQPVKPQKLPYKFSLKSSQADGRDFAYQHELADIREVVSLRSFDSPVDDQGILGVCSASATLSAYENLVNQKYPSQSTPLSRLYLYYHSRYIENNVMVDAGVYSLRSDMKSLKKYFVRVQSNSGHMNHKILSFNPLQKLMEMHLSELSWATESYLTINK